MDEVIAERDTALCDAAQRLEAVEAALREAKSEEHMGPRSKEYSDVVFDGRSEGAKRVARSRDVKYAKWFLSQRNWRVDDWISVFARRGRIEEVWECKEMWELRMAWMNEVLATCTSNH
eukprot:6192358-Pleurochrysis_carterae.AAC.3